MSEHDRAYRVGLNENQDVLLDLGLEARYIVLTPDRAMTLAALLTKHAKASTKAPRQQ